MAHKILIVQDDFLGAERLRVLLEGAGYVVAGVARRSLEALEIADRDRPDLAIVDMMLEVDVDGIEAATELSRRNRLEILITTGFPDSVIEAEGVHEFACAVVRKPYTDEELLAAVDRCLA
jgi:DNA-binding response OmpR family regulator